MSEEPTTAELRDGFPVCEHCATWHHPAVANGTKGRDCTTHDLKTHVFSMEIDKNHTITKLVERLAALEAQLARAPSP